MVAQPITLQTRTPAPDVARRHTTEYLNMSPFYAADVLITWKYDGQRALDRAWVSSLAGAIERGELTRIDIELAVVNGHRYLVDGQHRLHALASQHPERVLTARVTETVCRDMQDVAKLFATIDRGRIRTHAQMFTALGVPEQLGLTDRQARLLTYALTLIDSEFGEDENGALERTRSSLYRAKLAETWALEAVAFFDAISGASRGTRDYLTRAPVMAVALVTFRHQEPTATEFWRQIALDDGLTKGQPEHTLLRWLRDTPSRMHKSVTYARYVAMAWNAYYSRTTVTRLVVKEPGLPISILGTSYYRPREKNGG